MVEIAAVPVTELLDKLAEFRLAQEELRASLQRDRDAVLTDEQRKRIVEIEDEYSPKISAVDENLRNLEQTIKDFVVAKGVTIRGKTLMAVFTSGHVKWDTERLDGYSVAHPEILGFRVEGKPYVSIRPVLK